MWQHSACLGISQASAEKEDFHFICRDCERRKEDAKKPKIPSLKFRLGASSSPPSDPKSKTAEHESGPKKRKLQDESAKSPSPKRLKHVEIPVGVSPINQHSSQSSDGHGSLLHRIMNGPTLSPDGQSPMPSRGQNGDVSSPTQPPPGLASPPESRIKSNGYVHHDQRPSSSHFTAENRNGVPPGPAWLAGSSPPQNPLDSMANTPRTSFAYPQQNPFLNSFDRQRPLSSHSNYSNHSNHSVPSPTKSRPSLSSSQASHAVGPLAFPQPNGGFAPPPQIHSNGFSPIKHSSPSLGALSPSSGPVSKSPLPAAASGISPTKHSPPRPGTQHSVAGTPVVPPVTGLSPSPGPQDYTPPIKMLTFEQAQTNSHITTQ